MIVWGGYRENALNNGGRYNPTTDSWMPTTLTDAPHSRGRHSAVWTGTEMIVWGGIFGRPQEITLNTGGRYNPRTDRWVATTSTNVPERRFLHSTVWTGSEMIVWGGYNSYPGYVDLNTGGRYNPITDTWVATTSDNAPGARERHTAVWTGSEMLVFGGRDHDQCEFFSYGGRYNPVTNTWVNITFVNNPEARADHTAVWTGSEMIVWGGQTSCSPGGLTNTGGRYCAQPPPCTDNSWLGTSLINAPAARYNHTAVWTGSEMIVWGGWGAGNYLDSGGRYSPATDSWVTTTPIGSPSKRYSHTAVWTGRQMVVWGGSNGARVLNTGARYNPIADTWLATTPINAPVGRTHHTAVWTGSEMIVWGGYTGSSYLDSGARYNPASNRWVATTAARAPTARAKSTAVWTGHEMVVWGGYNGSFLNSGGRYNPRTNSWRVMTTNRAPDMRYEHTAVWTGGEMIVWGGYNGSFLNSGGRYNPSTNSWVATTTSSAPGARYVHTAVWTGSEMIVWGGIDSTSYLDSGGKYHPSHDRWVATTTSNAPARRISHTAVWTGSQMIVWGGNNPGLTTGGRYCP